MKKLFFLVIALVVIAGIFFALKNPTKNQPVLYSHSSGAFSFSHPNSLKIIEIEKITLIEPASATNDTLVNPLKSIGRFQAAYYPNYISELTNRRAEIQTFFANGNRVISATFPNIPQSGTVYLIPLEDETNPSAFIIGTLSANTEGFSQEKFEEIVKSLTVNKEKALELVQEQKVVMEGKLNEAQIKANLANMRSSAELYYDVGSSYASLCNPTATGQGADLLRAGFVALKKLAGETSVACYATNQAYAISAKMLSGQHFCVDSTGKAAAIKTAVKGTVCQ